MMLKKLKFIKNICNNHNKIMIALYIKKFKFIKNIYNKQNKIMIALYIKKFKFICLLIIFLFLYLIYRPEFPFKTNFSWLKNKKESGLYTIYKISNQSQIYFNSKNVSYFFSFKYNITQLEYNIQFYDESYHLIKPSDIIFFYGLRIFCYMQGINSNINIYSIAAIKDDQKFTCIEFFNNNDKIKFGIKILNSTLNNSNSIYFFLIIVLLIILL